MKNRALFLIDPADYNDQYIIQLCETADVFEEVIYVLVYANDLNRWQVSPGELLVDLHKMLNLHSKCPFYLIPYAKSKSDQLSYWIQLKLLTPAFQLVFSSDAADATYVTQILQCKYHHLSAANLEENFFSRTADNIRRGLYITRAQPFHHGHAAFVRQMSRECEEFIILLAAAEQSHLPQNPLSASERLEILHDYLEPEFSGRFFLMALPQKDFTVENMLELQFLVPEFHAVYATNSVIGSMCEALKIPTKILNEKVQVSATRIRNKIINGESYEDDVPPFVYRSLTDMNFTGRIKLLNHEYQR